MDVIDNFWEKYYNSDDIVGTPNFQKMQVELKMENLFLKKSGINPQII